MDPMRWSIPVSVVTEELGKLLAITSALEAADFLLMHWPLDETGPAHITARRACIQVLGGKEPPEFARAAFIKACEAAGIFVQAK